MNFHVMKLNVDRHSSWLEIENEVNKQLDIVRRTCKKQRKHNKIISFALIPKGSKYLLAITTKRIIKYSFDFPTEENDDE